MEVSEAKRLKALEEENRQLKQLLGEKELDILGLRTPGQVFEEGQPGRHIPQPSTGLSSGLVIPYPAGDSLNLASVLFE